MTKFLSIQGTSSDSGKSLLTMALCRIFADEGYKVAPFKAQNMSSNVYIINGLEMAKAQALQAIAARTKPDVNMNPILLKPMGNYISKVILLGREHATMHAKEYYNNFINHALEYISDAINYLKESYDLIIIEGAGSTAEINLRDYDITNMRLSEMVNANTIITADIDRGGVFASMLGTLELMDRRDLVKGFVINKFRGELDILKPAIDEFEQLTKKEILGVIPYISDIRIPKEDTLSLSNYKSNDRLDAIVIKYPNTSNLSEIDPLINSMNVTYIDDIDSLDADLIILPPSRDVITDLGWLYNNGLADGIRYSRKIGKKIIGINEGYAMLCRSIEGIKGLGLFDASYKGKEQIREYKKICNRECFIQDLFIIESKEDVLILKADDGIEIGLVSRDKNVLGYTAHQALDKFIDIVLDVEIEDRLDEEIDNLARIVKENIALDKIKKIIGL